MGFTVLIVDDHAGFRTWCRRLLEVEGVVVVGDAGDGRSAVAQVQALRPDVAIVDVGLPDIDGFEVAEALSRHGNTALVILTSTRSAVDYGPKLERSVAVGFIPKSEISAVALLEFLERRR